MEDESKLLKHEEKEVKSELHAIKKEEQVIKEFKTSPNFTPLQKQVR